MMWLASGLALLGLVNAQASESNATAPFPNSYYPEAADPRTAAGAKFGQTSPPVYPSPWADGSGDWAIAYERAQAFVKRLTLAEKVNLTTGVGWQNERCVGQVGEIPRLGFRSLCMQDSPLGIRFTDQNSAFPAGGTVAASFDRDVWYRRGFDMGSEHRDKGIDVQLGPAVGPLGRMPEGGRIWEGFSPDPVLSGIAVAQTVKGIQDAGVIACTKHYIGNEQEHFRQSGEAQGYGYNITESLSVNMDDVTLHELYLWPFADAVRAGTGSIMCSYNQINNSYGCQNSKLLNGILKGELGFQGFVMSDWQAHHSGVGASLAGLDMSMPGDTVFNTGRSYWGANLTVAVLNGTIPEWRVDDMATRIMSAWFIANRDKHQRPLNFDSWTTDTFGYKNYYTSQNYQLVNEHVNVRDAHAEDIRDFAAKSTVLLKNSGNALPLGNGDRFTGVFGYDAGDNPYGPNGCSDRGCDNGTLAMGWGSGTANFPYLISPFSAIQNEVLTNGNGVVQGIFNNYATDEITALASQATAALVFVNSQSGEGYISVDGNEGDRQNLTLWINGDNLIKTVASECNNTIVVIHSVGPVLVSSFYDNPNVTAILWAGLPGEQSGNSITDVLYGRVNPGGKLPFTMGRKRRDYGTDVLYKPNNGANAPQQQFREGVFIDYRGFDKRAVAPIYEFGFGLSYTTFAFSNLVVTPYPMTPYVPTQGRTKAAPRLGKPGSAAEYLVPANFSRIPGYIYPYLNSTNLRDSADDDNFGARPASYIPPGARDGSPQPRVPSGGAPGGNPQLYDVLFTIVADITNTGTVAGDEVGQVYVSLGGPDDPKTVLRNFQRVSVQPGQTATFGVDLTRRDLSNWDPVQQHWVVSSYPKRVFVGNSSRKLALSAPLNIQHATEQ